MPHAQNLPHNSQARGKSSPPFCTGYDGMAEKHTRLQRRIQKKMKKEKRKKNRK
jgi:hypothetical protein